MKSKRAATEAAKICQTAIVRSMPNGEINQPRMAGLLGVRPVGTLSF